MRLALILALVVLVSAETEDSRGNRSAAAERFGGAFSFDEPTRPNNAFHWAKEGHIPDLAFPLRARTCRATEK